MPTTLNECASKSLPHTCAPLARCWHAFTHNSKIGFLSGLFAKKLEMQRKSRIYIYSWSNGTGITYPQEHLIHSLRLHSTHHLRFWNRPRYPLAFLPSSRCMDQRRIKEDTTPVTL